MGERTIQDLQQLQGLPLNLKIRMTKDRIRQWINAYGKNGVYVSFSGGKDSTVLLHLVREMYGGSIPGVFCDTGLEYPEIREYVRTFSNIVWLKPKMGFKKVIEQFGYPVISKDVAQCVFDVNTQARILKCDKRETKLWDRTFNPESEYAKKYPGFSRSKYDFLNDAPFPVSHRCCDIIKKKPSKQYEKETGRKPILATMTCESRLRQTQWRKYGCNAFEGKRQVSKPMSFWTENDVLQYIKQKEIKICSVYGDIVEVNELPGQINWYEYIGFDIGQTKYMTTGCKRTGCMFCLFGCSNNDWDNLRRMKKTHPKQYDYIMRPWEEGGLNYKEVIDWINEHGNMNIKY